MSPHKVFWADRAAVAEDERRRAVRSLQYHHIESLYRPLLVMHPSLTAGELMTVFRLREENARRRGYANGVRVELLRQKQSRMKRHRHLLRALALAVLRHPRSMLRKKSTRPNNTATRGTTPGHSRRM